MKKMTSSIIRRIEAGERVVLCTILASSGSSPRGAGARMAVFSDGSTIGTVGGGRVEYLATQEALTVLQTGNTAIRSFQLAPNQVASIGMVCGGSVSIYYQLLTQEELPILHQMYIIPVWMVPLITTKTINMGNKKMVKMAMMWIWQQMFM